MAMSERETGPRAGFLARIAERQGPPPATGPHPPPPPADTVPVIEYHNLREPGAEEAGAGSEERDAPGSERRAPIDVFADAAREAESGESESDVVEVSPAGSEQRPLIDVFVEAARAADAEVDVVAGGLSAEDLLGMVNRYEVSNAVVSDEPEAIAIGDQLAYAGVTVSRYTPEVAAVSDVAITGATHGLASTGSVVVDSATAGSRAVSLLAPTHWCVLPAERIVATHADLLRSQTSPMPSCRAVITGPSRTADIEQRLTLGAHGPLALHIIVVRS